VAVQVAVGTALVLLFQDARNPKVVLAPAASGPFQAAGVAVTAVPLWVTVALQLWLTTWPLAKFQVTFQLVIGVLPEFLTVTPPWKLPDQKLEMA
jgi:hypothetical protein